MNLLSTFRPARCIEKSLRNWNAARRYAVAALLMPALLPGALALDLPKLAGHVADEHPRVRMLRAQVRTAQYELQQVRGGSGLKIGVFGGAGRSVSDGGLPSVSSSDAGVRLSYPLYDWGRADAEEAQAHARLHALRARVDAEIAVQWGRLADIYIDVLRNDGAAAVVQDYVSALGQLRERVHEIVLVDQGRGTELDQVDSRLQQARLLLMQRRTASAEALAQLRTFTNLPAAEVSPLASVSAALSSIPDTALDRLKSHPAVLDAVRQVAESEQAMHAARAQERPRVELRATVGSRDGLGRFRLLRTGDVQVVSQWDAFDGGSSRARSDGAMERLVAAREQVEVVRRDLAADLARTSARQQQLRERAALWRHQVEFMGQLRVAYWEQFRLGRRSMLDLLSVENDIYQTRLSGSVEQYDLLQSEYRLFIHTGLASERWAQNGEPAAAN